MLSCLLFRSLPPLLLSTLRLLVLRCYHNGCWCLRRCFRCYHRCRRRCYGCSYFWVMLCSLSLMLSSLFVLSVLLLQSLFGRIIILPFGDFVFSYFYFLPFTVLAAPVGDTTLKTSEVGVLYDVFVRPCGALLRFCSPCAIQIF